MSQLLNDLPQIYKDQRKTERRNNAFQIKAYDPLTEGEWDFYLDNNSWLQDILSHEVKAKDSSTVFLMFYRIHVRYSLVYGKMTNLIGYVTVLTLKPAIREILQRKSKENQLIFFQFLLQIDDIFIIGYGSQLTRKKCAIRLTIKNVL